MFKIFVTVLTITIPTEVYAGFHYPKVVGKSDVITERPSD
jgi:hypothetical protein